MDVLKNIYDFFDFKNNKINQYLNIEKSIQDKKQEITQLSEGYNKYKSECEELIKGGILNGIENNDTKSHIESRFNNYFINYVEQIDKIKKSVENSIKEKNILLSKYSYIKDEFEKAKKESINPSNVYLKSGIEKSEIDKAIVTIVQGFEKGIVSPGEFQKFKEEMEIFIPIEKAEEIKGGLADKKTLKDIAQKHKVSLESIQEQFSMGVKVEMEHTDDKPKAEEIAKDHLFETSDYYTKLREVEKKDKVEKAEDNDDIEKAEEAQTLLEKVFPSVAQKIRDILSKAKEEMIAKEPQELKGLKKYADGIIRNTENQILFLKRSENSDFEPNKFGFPGGHIDEGEVPEEAVKREVKEETGFDVEKCWEIGVALNPEIHYFNCQLKDDDILTLEGIEHKNYKWMDQEEWEKEDLIVGLSKNLKKLFDVNYNVKKL